MKFLTRQELQERCVSWLWAERELRLLDFGGPALQALNLDARLLHTCDELEQPDGLIYPSRMLPCQRNVAVFDRSSSHWRDEPLGNLQSVPDANGDPFVFQVLEEQGWGLVDWHTTSGVLSAEFP